MFAAKPAVSSSLARLGLSAITPMKPNVTSEPNGRAAANANLRSFCNWRCNLPRSSSVEPRRKPSQKQSFYQICSIPKPAKSDSTAGRKQQLADEKVEMLEYRIEHPWCEVKGCVNRTASVHHQKSKAMGGSRDPFVHSKANFLAVCNLHHMLFHHLKPADWMTR